MTYHEPVMLSQVLEFLDVREDGKYIDCTVGDGGHAIEILKKGGRVLGIDLDSQSVGRAVDRIKKEGLFGNFICVQGNFLNVGNIAENHGFSEVDGILYDLGYSSYQLGSSGLGLSFLADEKLDMRLDKSLDVTAADLVNFLSEKELSRLFFEYGEERYAKRFAKAIIQTRRLKKIQTTKDLSNLIVSAASFGYEDGRIHPATRVFQALRIAVNAELENLKMSLPRAARLLRPQSVLPGGRMVVITFHSLEDKVVKEFGKSAQSTLEPLTKRPIRPTDDQVRQNRRVRSAKLRAFEKKAYED